MGGDISQPRDVKPASLRANGMYDPVHRAETLGTDQALPITCYYCGVGLGTRKKFGGTFEAATETHNCCA